MRTRTALVIVLAVFAIAGALRLALGPESEAPVTAEPTSVPQRIVSLAPSITETLFALGAGDRVVGVTRYCDYPPETATKTVIGGFLDPNYEAIVRLEPDLVAVLVIHADAQQRLHELGIPTLAVDHRTVDGIFTSFDALGARIGASESADRLTDDLRTRMDTVREKTKGLPKPRVLISSARELGTGSIEAVYAAGRNQWYHELIERAGGENAYPDDGIAFPQLTPEGILRLDPDVIVEMAPELEERPYTEADLIAEWETIPGLRAVKENRVYVLSGDHVAIPGPRIVQVLEDLARVLHPEADWEAS